MVRDWPGDAYRHPTIYTETHIWFQGVKVRVSASNESEFTEWQYHAEGRIATVNVYQAHDDDDCHGPLMPYLTIEFEQHPGQWEWRLMHQKAIDYVTTGVKPVWEGR